MPRSRIFSLIVVAFLFEFVKAQDIIYLNKGTKFEAIIKEVNVNEIKYKNFSNPDGPTYVIAKTDVLLIEYKNGTFDVITKTPARVMPPQLESAIPSKKEIKKDPYALYYLGKNCVYINALALVNSDLSFMLEREFNKSRHSVVLFGAYNFNIATNYTNSYIQALNYSKKNYDLGAGINYFTQTKRRSQYFMGIWFKYMNYNYVRETAKQDTILGTPSIVVTQQNVNSYQFATLFMNGVQVRVTPFLTYRMFFGLGFTNRNRDVSVAVRDDVNQKARSFIKAYLGICIGYRFY
jgi:hypothetical protein